MILGNRHAGVSGRQPKRSKNVVRTPPGTGDHDEILVLHHTGEDRPQGKLNRVRKRCAPLTSSHPSWMG